MCVYSLSPSTGSSLASYETSLPLRALQHLLLILFLQLLLPPPQLCADWLRFRTFWRGVTVLPSTVRSARDFASSCSDLEHLSCLSLIRSAHRHQDEKQTVHALTSCPHIELVNITKETLFCDCRRSLKYRLSWQVLSSLSTTARTRALAPGPPMFTNIRSNETLHQEHRRGAHTNKEPKIREIRTRKALSLSLSLKSLTDPKLSPQWPQMATDSSSGSRLRTFHKLGSAETTGCT